ncbi:AAA family ATPase [Croceimicrobium hydrocarbonivorans]|uniref:MoxR family ATPase n=1 Tax=Croceimicrobium hydrocarbonivorans TaxID=2761580 RepID=A0A7H0VA18_9FLAO|nr:MoxR family ATPase [Croceimicrobium hydrocarbonivorans]QNR22566.1 MoxR family ATPase [Croceimicrobium hydrocarbonivorans]
MEENTNPESDAFEKRVDLSRFKASLERVNEQIGSYIVGQRKAVELLQVALIADGHVLIEGVPGIAKTQLAKLMARALDLDFSRVQFTPDLMPSDILGTSVYNQKQGEFEFKSGPVFSNVVLVDEINRAPAKTQAALFEVMEERQVTIDGHQHKMDEPYLILATQNPIEQEGTYRLPEAQLDRFLFKISMDYPSLDEEFEILKLHQSLQGKPEAMIQKALSKEDIQELRATAKQIHIEEDILRYIAAIVDATRNQGSLYLGASPRASLALLNSARALAAIQDRDFVSPDDIRFLAAPVLAHRVILSPEREMEGLSSVEVLDQIVRSIKVPGS